MEGVDCPFEEGMLQLNIAPMAGSKSNSYCDSACVLSESGTDLLLDYCHSRTWFPGLRSEGEMSRTPRDDWIGLVWSDYGGRVVDWCSLP